MLSRPSKSFGIRTQIPVRPYTKLDQVKYYPYNGTGTHNFPKAYINNFLAA